MFHLAIKQDSAASPPALAAHCQSEGWTLPRLKRLYFFHIFQVAYVYTYIYMNASMHVLKSLQKCYRSMKTGPINMYWRKNMFWNKNNVEKYTSK